MSFGKDSEEESEGEEEPSFTVENQDYTVEQEFIIWNKEEIQRQIMQEAERTPRFTREVQMDIYGGGGYC